MTAADVLVVGAGLAGLETATRLAELGHDVLLVERRAGLGQAIRTTGIFVRRTLDDFDLPPESLGPPVRRVMLYPPGLRRPVELRSERDEFRVGDMAALYAGRAADAAAAGVRLLLGTRYLGRDEDGTIRLEGPDGPLRVAARYLVGADGARSAVARDLGLDRNERLLIGAEEVHPVAAAGQEPTFHCVLDPSLAPGYIAWVVDDGEHAHVGVAGYLDRFRDGLPSALARFTASAPGLEHARRSQVERRGGAIPVGGLLRRIASPAGLLVGDAAGAVSPLTAGGLDPCLRQAGQAVEVLDAALCSGRPDALAGYDGAALRRRFRGRIALRGMLARLQSPTLASAAFRGVRTPLGRAAARAVLFGDRSFPDGAARSERLASRAA